MTGGAAKCCWRLALLPLLFLTGCLGNFQYLQDFKAVDGKLYLLVAGTSQSVGPFSFPAYETGRLLESHDGGRNWSPIREGLSASEIVFSGPSCLLFLQGDRLMRSRDGGRSAEQVPFEQAPLHRVIGLQGAAAAASQKTLFITRDCGESWDAVDIEQIAQSSDEPWAGSVAAAAIDGDRLAVASRFGRVYLRESSHQDWHEIIVGPISDLAYHQGKLYALTASMGTLTRIDASGFEHIYTEIRESSPGFQRCGKELHFLSHGQLLRLTGEGVETVAPVPATEEGTALPRAALSGSSCDQLLVVTSDFRDIKVSRHILGSGEYEQVSVISAPD